MKKVFNISFALVYLFLTTGFTITIHYCGGIVSDVSIVRTYGDKDPCGCDNSCGTSCCKDNVHTTKVDDSHKYEVKFNQNIISYLIGILSFEDLYNKDYNKIEIFTNPLICDLSPPNIYLHNCSFLI